MVAFSLSLGTTEMPVTVIRCLIHMVRFRRPFSLQAEQFQLSEPLKPFLEPLPVCLGFTHPGETRTAPSAPDVALTLLRAEEKDHLPLPAGDVIPNAAQEAVGGLCPKGSLLPHGQLGAHQDLQGPPYQAAFQLASPSLSWYMELFLLRGRTLQYPFVELHEAYTLH